MKQKEFTNYIIPRLIAKFPQFKNHLVEISGDVMNIEFKSNAGQLELWITTQDSEITIGLDDQDGLNHWHRHITSYDNALIDEDINYVSEIIENILNGKTEIIYSNLNGYAIADPEDHLSESFGEILEVKPWSKW